MEWLYDENMLINFNCWIVRVAIFCDSVTTVKSKFSREFKHADDTQQIKTYFNFSDRL